MLFHVRVLYRLLQFHQGRGGWNNFHTQTRSGVAERGTWVDSLVFVIIVQNGTGHFTSWMSFLRYLENNMLNGTIPPTLGQLTFLQQLWLQNNDLEGAIPPQLGNLKNVDLR